MSSFFHTDQEQRVSILDFFESTMVSKQFTYAFMFECGNFVGKDRNCTILIRTPMIIKKKKKAVILNMRLVNFFFTTVSIMDIYRI